MTHGSCTVFDMEDEQLVEMESRELFEMEAGLLFEMGDAQFLMWRRNCWLRLCL